VKGRVNKDVLFENQQNFDPEFSSAKCLFFEDVAGQNARFFFEKAQKRCSQNNPLVGRIALPPQNLIEIII